VDSRFFTFRNSHWIFANTDSFSEFLFVFFLMFNCVIFLKFYLLDVDVQNRSDSFLATINYKLWTKTAAGLFINTDFSKFSARPIRASFVSSMKHTMSV